MGNDARLFPSRPLPNDSASFRLALGKREMKENRDSLGHDDPVRLSEVRLAEKVLRYVRGSMMEAGWEHG